jgi:hypothetical protein
VEDRVERIFYSEASVVVIARHYYANRQLLGVAVEIPDFVDSVVLLLLHPLLLLVVGSVQLVVEGRQVKTLHVLLT